MAKTPPPLLRLCDLAPGQSADFFALLSEKTRGARRDGQPYYTCRFRDRERQVSFMVWKDSPWFPICEKEWIEGQFYKIRGTFENHDHYGPQLDIVNIRPIDAKDASHGFDPGHFVDATRHSPDAMFQELWNLAESQIADVPLRRLVLTLFERHSKRFKSAPASTRHFYPFVGGLLEHTLSVAKTCLHLADKYAATYDALQPPLNRDLVLAGAMLHDIGRCLELTDDIVQPQQTVPGALLGHIQLGRDLVRETARELGDVDPELLQLLEHLILSHLALPEWGSPRLPMIPEVLILHHADDLDAKLEMYARRLARDTEAGPFTARDPILGKKLLKRRQR